MSVRLWSIARSITTGSAIPLSRHFAVASTLNFNRLLWTMQIQSSSCLLNLRKISENQKWRRIPIPSLWATDFSVRTWVVSIAANDLWIRVMEYVLFHQDSRTDGVWLWLSDWTWFVRISRWSTGLSDHLTATSYNSGSFLTAFSGKKKKLPNGVERG